MHAGRWRLLLGESCVDELFMIVPVSSAVHISWVHLTSCDGLRGYAIFLPAKQSDGMFQVVETE